ncbi:isocitrate lyase/PEP mutase family protein [Actinopolymorpha rutila]|uniref:2-methylisocitrate lyase-like PEP mutase family enzyme n=1 Tax=Actinopolymorpha rutila TaxID=446787 RepID=A0A852ZNU0_9ACTN|nr:isocitrate lyase/phosphoenolpyruvate mutase family protein [Actinopolymorpha rutila]NYH90750.1 2-methylisocitrate lyase-like PEP mutase family enzyme [Actinopolymorpha rutila]
MSVETFRALHHGRAAGDPLILPGPWDVASARVFVDAGFPALATPSMAIAASLGYSDGQGTPPAEMFAAIARITRAVEVPVSADVEAGYGLPPAELVERVLEAGAVGVNLEDSDPATHALVEPKRQADYLAAVRAAAGDDLFVNARIDTYVRDGDPSPDRTIERGKHYAAAGADGVYPIFAPPEHLRVIADGIGLPVNAVGRPDGPSPRELGRMGATRITFGGGLHLRTLATLKTIAEQLTA